MAEILNPKIFLSCQGLIVVSRSSHKYHCQFGQCFVSAIISTSFIFATGPILPGEKRLKCKGLEVT